MSTSSKTCVCRVRSRSKGIHLPHPFTNVCSRRIGFLQREKRRITRRPPNCALYLWSIAKPNSPGSPNGQYIYQKLYRIFLWPFRLVSELVSVSEVCTDGLRLILFLWLFPQHAQIISDFTSLLLLIQCPGHERQSGIQLSMCILTGSRSWLEAVNLN